MVIELIKKIHKNKKVKYKKISKLLNNKKNYIIKFNDDTKRIDLFNNDTKFLSATYFFLGIVQENNIWLWASSIPGINSKILKQVKKIRNMAYLFENNKDIKMLFYYQLLSQDMMLITNDQQIDWINDLLLYLTDGIYYLNPTNKNNNIQIIILKKIIEQFLF